MFSIFKPKQKKVHQRFYLLPGMGGRAFHRKQRRIRTAAIIVGVIVSAVLAVGMYFLNEALLK